MGNYDITLEWSKLLSLTSDEINKLNLNNIGGVYRVSRKESDGKFYVIFVGSTANLGEELQNLISEKNNNFLKQNSEFSFRYALVKSEETRKAVEKQMYKQYAPEYNPKEPISSLEIKVNLN